MVDNATVTRDDLNSFGKRIEDLQRDNRITLKDYIDSRFEALAERTEQARFGMEKRLDGMNEFRNTLKDQSDRFVLTSSCNTLTTKYNEKLESIDGLIKSLELTRASIDGKASRTSAIIIGALSMTGIFLAIASMVMAIFKG